MSRLSDLYKASEGVSEGVNEGVSEGINDKQTI
jgi:hypothetical protein